MCVFGWLTVHTPHRMPNAKCIKWHYKWRKTDDRGKNRKFFEKRQHQQIENGKRVVDLAIGICSEIFLNSEFCD